MDSPGLDVGDGALDHLADPVDALILLLRLLLVEFAIGGLLMGRDHPSSHIALVADPPGGVHSLQQSERRLVRPRVHGPRIGAPGPTRTLRRAGPGSGSIPARTTPTPPHPSRTTTPIPGPEPPSLVRKARYRFPEMRQDAP